MACEGFLDFYDECAIVNDNEFKRMGVDKSAPPAYSEVKHLLPEPYWAGHPSHIAAYHKTWEIAFSNLNKVHRGNGFIAPYIVTAFNDCVFLCDTSFILMFTKYGERAFQFQRTLDNLYAKQHADGFISREIREHDGTEQFHRNDAPSTGPNVLAWSEWCHYETFGDKARLAAVFPPLLGYHQWMRTHRSWPDGSFFSCGLACGMDNQVGWWGWGVGGGGDGPFNVLVLSSLSFSSATS